MSKSKFRRVWPSATIERHRTAGGEVYFLVRKSATSHWYAGEGSTPGKAWADAWRRNEGAARRMETKP